MYVKYDARHYVESPIRSGERLSYTSLHIVTHRYTSLDPIGPFERRRQDTMCHPPSNSSLSPRKRGSATGANKLVAAAAPSLGRGGRIQRLEIVSL